MLTEKQIIQYYNCIGPKLLNYLIAKGLSYSIACDIVQEAFIRVWQKKDTLVSDSSISGFVFTVARNLVVDFFRKNKRLVFKDVIEDFNCASDQNICDDDIKYLRKRLQLALNQLTDEMREAYTLSQIGKNSIKDIAVLMDCSESLVKTRISRAKEKLRTLLEDLQDF